MRQIIRNYTFNKTAKTITFSDFASISIDRLQLVTNVTSNIIIYQFNEPALGGSASGNVLTLNYNTAAMSNTDKLQIIYDCANGDPLYDATPASSTVEGNVSAGAQDSGKPVKVGGKYNATPFTMSNGQRGDLQLDVHGNLNVNLATALVAEDPTNKAFRVEGYNTELTSLSASGINSDLVPSADVSNLSFMSLQVTGAFVGTFQFQTSNDGSNWINFQLHKVDASTSSVTGAATSPGFFTGYVPGRFVRVRSTAYTSGTATGTVEFYSNARVNSVIGATQQGAFNTSVNGAATVTTVSVNTSSTNVLNANAGRRAVILSNVGANNIYINLSGSTAVATNMLIAPNTTFQLDRYVPTTAITAIASTGATSLSVTEIV